MTAEQAVTGILCGLIDEHTWIRSNLYPQRCDLSPDGRWLCYFTLRGKAAWRAGTTYVAISRLPWLTALAAWGTCGTWTRGAHFIDERGRLEARPAERGRRRALPREIRPRDDARGVVRRRASARVDGDGGHGAAQARRHVGREPAGHDAEGSAEDRRRGRARRARLVRRVPLGRARREPVRDRRERPRALARGRPVGGLGRRGTFADRDGGRATADPRRRRRGDGGVGARSRRPHAGAGAAARGGAAVVVYRH